MARLSTAKWRTRTGCLQCRRRRKKCDERTPQCGGCTRIGLVCNWPSGQETDRRIHRNGRLHREDNSSRRSVVETELYFLQLPPPVAMPSPFHHDQHRYLFRYFSSTTLPRLIRQKSLARYTDQTYMLRLALEFPPLMGALISIAGMQIASSSGWSVHCAVESYIKTLNFLQSTLCNKAEATCDDSLLATVVTLAVFESCRVDATPNIAPHVMASGTLLTQRCPRWAGSAQAAAVFDRICVESFVYHASVMMAFDPCLDVLSDPQRRLGLSRYFSDPVHLPSTSGEPEVVNQPILHTSYEFFLLIADTTKLARIPGPLSNAELAIREDLESQLSQFVPGIMTTRNHAEMLYLYALQIMLMKGYPGIDSKEADRTIITHLQGAMNTLLMVDPEQYFASFLLWPLAIFGAVMVLQDEIQVIRDYLTILQEMRAGGQAKWTLKRLEEIWRGRYHLDTAPDHCTRRWIGLQTFLDGNNRD